MKCAKKLKNKKQACSFLNLGHDCQLDWHQCTEENERNFFLMYSSIVIVVIIFKRTNYHKCLKSFQNVLSRASSARSLFNSLSAYSMHFLLSYSSENPYNGGKQKSVLKLPESLTTKGFLLFFLIHKPSCTTSILFHTHNVTFLSRSLSFFFQINFSILIASDNLQVRCFL